MRVAKVYVSAKLLSDVLFPSDTVVHNVRKSNFGDSFEFWVEHSSLSDISDSEELPLKRVVVSSRSDRVFK